MKKFLFLALLLFAAPVFATGIYYDTENSGEGMIAVRDGDRVAAYFYTYGGEDCDWRSRMETDEVTVTATAECPADENGRALCEPVTTTATERYSYPVYERHCNLNGQRWFLLTGTIEEGEVEGTLYITEGVEYPIGVISPDNPFEYQVGKVVPVGTYVLEEFGDGYRMRVFQLGDDQILDDDDWVFQNIFTFDSVIMLPN